MRSSSTDATPVFFLVACPECGIKNRIAQENISSRPICGKCKAGLIRIAEEQPPHSPTHEKTGFLLVACPDCGIKNRIAQENISSRPICGKCKSDLNSTLSGQQKKASAASDRQPDRHTSGPSVPETSDDEGYKVGDFIGGRYQIQDIMGGRGRSSMGIVYVCHDSEQGRDIALKTLQKRYRTSRKVMDSFKKEALAWIHLEKHPYIVQAYWVRELDNRMFIACEYISPDFEGRNSLTAHMKRPFSMRRTLTWAIQFCYGMEYSCSKGVTPHRDIKPDNILVTVDGDIKITDFGLVGLWDKSVGHQEIKDLMEKNRDELTFLTSANNRIVAGSPPWMAPEQFYGLAKTAGDIYSFGIVLCQMINNGERPFKPKQGDAWAIVHKTHPIPRLPAHGKALQQIIHKCLQKRYDRRYGDFAQLRGDLEDIFMQEITNKTGEKPPPAPVLESLKDAERINKSVSLANLGLVDEAIKQYRDAIGKDPENTAVRNNLGNALVKKGLVTEAISEYRHALRIDPSLPLTHFNLGLALLKKGWAEEAIESFEDALELDPDFAEAYLNLGIAYSEAGMPEYAMKNYKETIRCRPGYAEAHCKIGLALFKKGLIDDAINSFERASKLKSEYADPYYFIGVAFIRKDLKDRAMQCLEEFLRYAPKDDGRIEKARELLEKLKNTR